MDSRRYCAQRPGAVNTGRRTAGRRYGAALSSVIFNTSAEDIVVWPDVVTRRNLLFLARTFMFADFWRDSLLVAACVLAVALVAPAQAAEVKINISL